jgi:hypothetical protein
MVEQVISMSVGSKIVGLAASFDDLDLFTGLIKATESH